MDRYTDKGVKEKKALTRSENKLKPLPSMFERHAEVFSKLGFSVNLSNPIFPKKTVLKEDITGIIGTRKPKTNRNCPCQYDSKPNLN
jgi:hypothetical protein